MPLAGVTLALLPSDLPKTIIVLKLALKLCFLIWPLPPLEAVYQGPTLKVLKSSQQANPPLAHLISMPNGN